MAKGPNTMGVITKISRLIAWSRWVTEVVNIVFSTFYSYAQQLLSSLVYLTNEESVMGMGAITFIVDINTHSKRY